MRKRSRLLAGLLSAAMVTTSIYVPVMAEEPVTDNEVYEEVSAEDDAQFEEASAEDTSEEYVGGTEEETVDAGEAESEAVSEAADEAETDGMIGDAANGDTMIYVSSIKEFKEAIEAVKPGVKTLISLKAPYEQENDDDYTLSANEVIEIGAGKDIVIESSGDRLGHFDNDYIVDLNEKGEPFSKFPTATFKVASGAKVVYVSSNSETFGMNIVNEGDLTFKGSETELSVYTGAAVTNAKGGRLVLEDIDIFSADSESSLIVNEGDIVLDGVNFNGLIPEAPGSDRYLFVNRGTALLEETRLGSEGVDILETVIEGDKPAVRYSYEVLNDKEATLTVRGDSRIYNLLNRGAVSIGEENSPGTVIERLFITEGSSAVQHDGTIDYVGMGNEGKGVLSASGTFTQVGGYVLALSFNDVLPVLSAGEVELLQHAVSEKDEEGVYHVNADQDFTKYKFIGYIQGTQATAEAPKPAFRLFDEKADAELADYAVEGKDGKKYLVADDIINGVPYIAGVLLDVDRLPGAEIDLNLNVKPIKTVADLKAAAASETPGVYYIERPAEGDFVITEPIEVKNPGLSFYGDYEYAVSEEETAYSIDTIYFTGAGSFKIAEGAKLDFESYGSNIDIYATDIENPLTGVLFENSGELRLAEVRTSGTTKNVIVNNGILNSDYPLRAAGAEAAVVLNNEKGELDLYNIRAEGTKAPALENKGTANVHRVYAAPAELGEGKYTTGVSAIVNSGNLFIDNGTITSYIESSVVLDNTGETVVNDWSSEIQAEAKNTTVVLNSGTNASFLMNDGSIYAYRYDEEDDTDKAGSFAIAYTDNEPVLMGGSVYGSRSDLTHAIYERDAEGNIATDAAGKPKYVAAYNGSAVVKKTGASYETGSYKNSPVAAAAIDSKNAGVISEGEIPYEATVSVGRNFQYLLMEVGESVAAYSDNTLEEPGAFYLDVDENTFGVPVKDLFTLSSTAEGVVTFSEIKASVFDAEKYTAESGDADTLIDVITAAKPGYTTVKATFLVSGTEEYFVAEVVKAGEREKIVASSYDVTLSDPIIEINPLKKYINVGIDWHLKNYESVAGSYDFANNFRPVGAIVTGSDPVTDTMLTKYFAVNGYLQRNSVNKTWYISMATIPIYGEEGGVTTYLAQDEVSKLENLNVYLVVENTVSKKTYEIPANTKLSLNVKYAEPTVKFDKQVINSAYASNLEDAALHLPYDSYESSFGTIDDVELATNARDFTYIDGQGITYTGSAKGGSYKVPVCVTFNEYYGKCETVVPVSVKATFPKVSLVTKKLSLPEKAGDFSNVTVTLTAKTRRELAAVAHVAIEGDSVFEVGGLGDIYSSSGVYYRDVQLKPRADLGKGEKTNLRVYYAGIKLQKGKIYTTALSLAVKTVEKGKYKIDGFTGTLYAAPFKAEGSEQTKMVTNSSAYVEWSVNPSDAAFTDGYFVVTSLDGKAYVADYEGDDAYDGVTRSHDVRVFAMDSLTEKDKAVKIQIRWVSSDGTDMASPLVVSVPVNQQAGTVADLKEIKLDFNKQLTHDGSEYAKIDGELWNDKNQEGYFLMGSTSLKLTNGMSLMSIDYHGADSFFDVFINGNKLYVRTCADEFDDDLDALREGYIIPGSSYTFDLIFASPNGEPVTKSLKVSVSDVKKVKTEGTTLNEMSPITGYARTMLSLKSETPYYGLKVESVQLTGSSASMFDVAPCTYFDNTSVYDYNRYLLGDGTYVLTWKNNVLPANVKSGNIKVTMDVKYTCGAVSKVSVPLVIADPNYMMANEVR